MYNNDNRWYAVFAQTGKEEAIKNKLQTCLENKSKPVIIKRKLKERKKGIWTDVQKNLYPGYILVYGKLNKYDCININRIPGTIKVLSDKDGPIPIAQKEMQIIEKLIDMDGIIGYSNAIIKNSKVIITDGPLKNCQGLVKSINKRKSRAKVKVQFLGEERLVDFGIKILDKVE